MQNDKNILVSVFMMAYNHESFIGQAIESILMQKVKFNYEIVLGEDCSTDKTREIILSYSKKNPEKFKLILHKKNVGPWANQTAVLNSCTGKYIAVCEGDDYWTDPNKLQKQVDFLEANSEYIACCHDVMVKNEITNTEYLMWSFEEMDITIEKLALGNIISTLSVVFRNDKDVINKSVDFFNNYPQSPIGDYVLFMFLAEKGKIRYFSEVMGIFRIHKQNTYTVYNDIFKYTLRLENWVIFLKSFRNYFNCHIKKNIETQIIHMEDELRFMYLKNKDYVKFQNISIKWKNEIRKNRKARKAWSIRLNAIAYLDVKKGLKKEAFNLYKEGIKFNPFWRGNYIDLIKYFILKKQI